MRRKPTAYPIVRLLFLVLMIALLPVSVWAQETTLTANVPSVHTLHIELTGNGKIIVDGVPYKKTADIQIKRHSAPAIFANPDSGWKLESVSFGGKDITEQIQNGTFTCPEMCDNAELIVVFETQSSAPQTGDKTNIEILSLAMLLSVLGMILCVVAHRKEANAK